MNKVEICSYRLILTIPSQPLAAKISNIMFSKQDLFAHNIKAYAWGKIKKTQYKLQHNNIFSSKIETNFF